MKKLLFLLLVLCIPRFSHADTISVIRHVSLGTVVIVDNSSPSEITVKLDGSVINSGSIGVLVSGHPAEFLLTDFPSFTRLSVTPNILLSETKSDAPLNSAQFTITNLETEPTVLTDSDGSARVFMGATFRTSGNGAESYYDTEYTVKVQLLIDIDF